MSIALIAKIGNALQRPAAMAVAASSLILMGSAGPAHWFSGMESAVLLPCLLAVILVFVRTDGLQAARMNPRSCTAFGGLLAITVLSRLDMVFLVVAVAGFALWRLRAIERTMVARCAAGIVVPPIATIVVYALLNEAWFGTATPVSGQAKALGAPFANTKPIGQFLRSPIFLDHSSWFGLLVLVTVPLALMATRRGATDAARGLAYGAAVLLVAELLMVAYYSVASSWQLWSWYLLLTDVVLTASLAARFSTTRDSSCASPPSRSPAPRSSCSRSRSW